MLFPKMVIKMKEKIVSNHLNIEFKLLPKEDLGLCIARPTTASIKKLTCKLALFLDKKNQNQVICEL